MRWWWSRASPIAHRSDSCRSPGAALRLRSLHAGLARAARARGRDPFDAGDADTGTESLRSSRRPTRSRSTTPRSPSCHQGLACPWCSRAPKIRGSRGLSRRTTASSSCAHRYRCRTARCRAARCSSRSARAPRRAATSSSWRRQPAIASECVSARSSKRGRSRRGRSAMRACGSCPSTRCICRRRARSTSRERRPSCARETRASSRISDCPDEPARSSGSIGGRATGRCARRSCSSCAT